jgi:predicted DNA-binding transcriptional regulator YafY
MRADRLVAILLLLQQRGQVTAGEVAEELEVSERTARRDLEALGMAGLPIYSQQGRGGGWRLAGDGKTDLSGLNAAEARALFLVAGPASAATPQVKAAVRKLIRALPEPMRVGAEAAATAIVVDHGGWGERVDRRDAPGHLDAVQQAVVEGLELELGYTARDGAVSRRTVQPLGLAAKGRTWYLVADTAAGQRTFRVDRITAVEPTGQPATRPPGFELAAAWQEISDEVERTRLPMTVTGWAEVDVAWLLRTMFFDRVRIGPPGPDGRIPFELRGAHEHALAGELAGLGARIEVDGPPEVRARLATIAAEITGLYATPSG